MNTESPVSPLRIDIVSDVVCPWCIVGYMQLEQALKLQGVQADIHWQPFELNPEMPPEGENLAEHIQKKYGTSEQDGIDNRNRLTELGDELGFPFRFGDDMRMVNTFRAHQLLHWAATMNRQHQLKMTLFHCHFNRNRDISDVDVLANAAVEAGLEYATAAAILEDERYADAVREQERFSISHGIQGVPAVIFDRQSLLVGAQGVERYKEVLSQVQNG